MTQAPESFGIFTDLSDPQRPVLWIAGADARGALFGVGRLLRMAECRLGNVRLPEPPSLTSAPQYAIRVHHLNYQAIANSYDAWSPEQFDQYVRELSFFGTNGIEGRPFHDDRPTVNSYPRRKMSEDLSRICQRYGLDYWIYTVADFDLNDTAKRSAMLENHVQLFRDCPQIDQVFFAGGDPGNNPPELVIPYLEELAELLARRHPKARLWLSLQGYQAAWRDSVYAWMDEHKPKWLGGLCAGPGSEPLSVMRARLDSTYRLRDYPDITHIVRCQYPVQWLDQSIAFTLGREGVNPRPTFFASVIRETAPFTHGFGTYSEGVNDDANKALWSLLAWDLDTSVRDVMLEYGNVFFGADVAEEAADGLLALERVYEGPLATNGGVEATLGLWQRLEARAPHLAGNWRWQMYQLRANYDAYTRHRLIYEERLEEEANEHLLQADALGADAAMDRALAVLAKADTDRVRPELRERVVALCDDLFHSIGLQTSVEKYGASGPERGAVLDFLDYPLNDRWWLEDEIAKVRLRTDGQEKRARLDVLARWEHPGPGSFYDSVGNIAKSPRVVRGHNPLGPYVPVAGLERRPGGAGPGFMWLDEGARRTRLAWISGQWPVAMRYTALDPAASYVLRTAGVGDCLPRVNGVSVAPEVYGKEFGDIKEFPVPSALYAEGNITLTFDPISEPGVNWRHQSRLSEVWLIKQ
jgi:hypothetical protein